MVTVRGLTEEAIEALLSDNIVNARVQSGDLILTTRGGVDKNLGSIKGATGSTGGVGPTGPPGPARVITDTGWILFQTTDLATSVVLETSEAPPRYRKRDGVVYVWGYIQVTENKSSGQDLLTLPAGYRPFNRMYFTAVSNDLPVTLQLKKTGVLSTTTNLPQNYWLTLSIPPFIAEN